MTETSCAGSERSPARPSRRELIVGGVALSAVAGRVRSSAAIDPFPEAAADVTSTGCPFLDLQQQIWAMRRRWDEALDLFAAAEQAFWAAGAEQATDEVTLDALRAQHEQADEDVGALCNATRALAERLCALPPQSLAHLAIKAKVALSLGFDGLPGLILEDIVRLAAADQPGLGPVAPIGVPE